MKQRGFSLIELMIAVAVIGVLVAIAVPNYQRMVGRSRQAEAKIDLSKIFSAMSVFRQERGSYSLCLWQAGYRPEPAPKRYYGVGYLNEPGGAVCAAGHQCWTYDFRSGASCSPDYKPYDGSTRNDATFNENFAANASLTRPLGDLLPTPAFSPTTNGFLAGAWGSISSRSTNLDVWSVDDKKNFVHIRDGAL